MDGHIERMVNKIGQICTHKCSKIPPVKISDIPYGQCLSQNFVYSSIDSFNKWLLNTYWVSGMSTKLGEYNSELSISSVAYSQGLQSNQ